MNKAPFELLSLEKIIPIDNYLNYSQVKLNQSFVSNIQKLCP